MDEVRWVHTAVMDLDTKVRTAVVRKYLLAVARSALSRPPGPWGGRLDGETWWRRGVTPEDEDDPDAVPGGELDDGRLEMAYDFVWVYLRPIVARTPPKVVVIRLVTNDELVTGLRSGTPDDGPLPRWSPPQRPPRGRRINRPRGGDEDRR